MGQNLAGPIRWGVVRWGRVESGLFIPTGGRSNIIFDQAGAIVADIMRGATPPITAFAIGDNGNPPLVTQTGLLNERQRTTIPAPGTNTTGQANLYSGNTMTIRQSFTGVTAYAIAEAALVAGIASPPGASGTGRFINRVIVGPISMGASDVYAIEFNLTFNNAGGMQEVVLKGTSAVTTAATTITLTIANFAPGSSVINVEPSWGTTWYQDTTYTTLGGVKINFGTGAPAGASLKYMAVI